MKSIQIIQNVIMVFVLLIFASCTSTEVVKITNKISNEKIYLRYWEYDYPISVISLNRFAGVDTCRDIVVKNEGVFFYKLKNDTLYIYTYGMQPIKENVKKAFKTKIVYQEMINGNADVGYFCGKYKKLGYEIFPPSWAYYAKNTAESDSLAHSRRAGYKTEEK